MSVNLTGRINALNIDYVTDKALLTLEINESEIVKQVYNELSKTEKLSIKIKKYQQKRSLSANAYAWVLMDKLATKLNTSKIDIYKNYIKEIGGVSTTVCVQNEAVEELCHNWQSKGLGWQTDTLISKLNGCTNVVLYYGSSVYDTAQMSRLIDMIVEDCKQQGIETLTPEELNKMKSLWGDKCE